MNRVAIRAEGLSKQYRIGKGPSYKTLRDSLTGLASAAFRPWRRKTPETIWALRDVSFEIEPGEVVGVIGRNGSGKSTLLKILSRITEPTEGRAEIHGRVGSLLEVGTGFHLELTGRENIFLSGAILGMRRAEIERKFDEIVEFAEVEKFIDTPVKHYSSGMYLRLAFAVAAHLEPEILLVDEVLAVGDAAFQTKCLGKMGDVAAEGRTVLFVSHNMTAVQRLCGRCIWISKGSIGAVGGPAEVVATYLAGTTPADGGVTPGDSDLSGHENPYPPHAALIRRIRLLDKAGSIRQTFQMGEPMTIEVEVAGLDRYRDGMLGVIFKSQEDQWLAGINTGMRPLDSPRARRGAAPHPTGPFTPGIYWIGSARHTGRLLGSTSSTTPARFQVVRADVYGSGYVVSSTYGLIFLDGAWEVGNG